MGLWSSIKGAASGLANLGKVQGDPNASQYADRDYINQQLRQGIGGAQNRAAPTVGQTQLGRTQLGQASQIDQNPQAQFRGMEMGLANRLQGVASGQQAGAGELAVNRQIGQALAAQQAQARGARGAGAGMAALSAARNSGDIGLAGAGQAAQAQMSDQANANAQLAGVLGQGRGADIGMATSQAGFGQQMGMANMNALNQATSQQGQMNQATSLANLQAQLQQTGMNDQAIAQYMQQLTGMNANEMQARMQQEQSMAGQSGLVGSLMSAGAPILASAMLGPAGPAVAGALTNSKGK